MSQPPTPMPGAPVPAGRLNDDHHAPTIARNARVGLLLFAVYLALYAGFMILSAFFPRRMAAAPAGGINLAVWYGLGLIVGAFVLALLYMFLVRRAAAEVGADVDPEGGRRAAGERQAP